VPFLTDFINHKVTTIGGGNYAGFRSASLPTLHMLSKQYKVEGTVMAVIPEELEQIVDQLSID